MAESAITGGRQELIVGAVSLESEAAPHFNQETAQGFKFNQNHNINHSKPALYSG